MQQASVKEQVRRYWQEHPLGSLDLQNVGSREYFEGHDQLVNHEIPFAMHLFEFDRHASERVLDIGCGPGWLVRNFARGGAKVVGVDLTHRAVTLTRESLRLFGLTAQVGVADAEKLPFPDNCFDFVTSNGVLHCTPDTEGAFQEALRVLKAGHGAMISVYYKHWLLRRPLFPLTRLMLRLGSLRAAGRTRLTTARTVDEFIRAYDGDGNPLGRAYDFAEFRHLCQGFDIVSMEVHFFPRRFFPFGKYIPAWLHRHLNRHFGTLIYARLRKPAGGTNLIMSPIVESGAISDRHLDERPGASSVFIENRGCPFCDEPSSTVLCEVQYHDTAETNRLLPNITGRLFECQRCGVAFPSHQYRLEAFPQLYDKTFQYRAFLDDNLVQVVRKRYLKAILRRAYTHPVSRLLDAATLRVLQVPRLTRTPRNLRLLDVGCGFGEFLSIYESLGNDCIGTEIIPQLVERNRGRGLRCEFGELEEIDLGDAKFEVILLRAVFYRTRHPRVTLEYLKSLLAPGGEIALVDPCVGRQEAEYLFRMQFPQGQFYILEPKRYLEMLRTVHRLEVVMRKQIYGRPRPALKPVRSIVGSLVGLAELAMANLLRIKPYMLIYTVRSNPDRFICRS